MPAFSAIEMVGSMLFRAQPSCWLCGRLRFYLPLKPQRIRVAQTLSHQRCAVTVTAYTVRPPVQLLVKQVLNYASQARAQVMDINAVEYERLADETLESLIDYFDTISDHASCPTEYDATYSQGVLTVNLGAKLGIYVINKQAPNKQIWLSSPYSGPKRYDFATSGRWVYMHDNEALHDLLNREFRVILQDKSIDFTVCSNG